MKLVVLKQVKTKFSPLLPTNTPKIVHVTTQQAAKLELQHNGSGDHCISDGLSVFNN